MKLVHIYHVVKDEHFLVELLDDQLTLDALKTAVQDRGIHPQRLLSKLKAGLQNGQYRLYFDSREFKRRGLPNSCFRYSHNSFQIFPLEVDPSARFTILVKVQIMIYFSPTKMQIKGSNASKPLQIKGLCCSDTVQDLKSKILKISQSKCRKLEIKKDGRKLSEDRLLFYYGFTDETQLEAVPSSDAIYEDKRSNISGLSLR
jgi:hypothetical protein